MSPTTTPNVNESNEFCVLRQKYAKLTTIKEMFLAWSGEDILSLLGKVNEVNGSLEVAVMHISEGEFLALIFVLQENHTMLIHVLVPQIILNPLVNCCPGHAKQWSSASHKKDKKGANNQDAKAGKAGSRFEPPSADAIQPPQTLGYSCSR